MSLLRNVLTYMGLGPDEDYDDGYLYEAAGPEGELDLDRPQRPRRGRTERDPDDQRRSDSSAPWRDAIRIDPEPAEDADPPRRRQLDLTDPDRRPVRPLRAVPTETGRPDDGVSVRPLPPPPGQDGGPPAGPQIAKPRLLAPRSFGDAKILADEFKRSVPVIMNLQAVDRDLARRLIDFASGVCYSLDGSMEKIASQVFLLTPQSVQVSDEDRRRFER